MTRSRVLRACVIQLAVLPVLIALALGGHWLAIAIGVAMIVAAAETGRRRAHATRVFPASAPFFAPLWVAERAMCSWLALGARIVLGGVPYRGTILHSAATPMRVLRQRLASQRTTSAAASGASSSTSIGLNVPLFESSAEHAVTPTIMSISARSTM